MGIGRWFSRRGGHPTGTHVLVDRDKAEASGVGLGVAGVVGGAAAMYAQLEAADRAAAEQKTRPAASGRAAGTLPEGSHRNSDG